MASEQMPKFDVNKDKNLLNKTAIDFMKIIEQQNRERVEKLRKLRSKNVRTGLILGGLVLSIYSYSIYLVKQETFLDDFEKPVLVPKED